MEPRGGGRRLDNAEGSFCHLFACPGRRAGNPETAATRCRGENSITEAAEAGGSRFCVLGSLCVFRFGSGFGVRGAERSLRFDNVAEFVGEIRQHRRQDRFAAVEHAAARDSPVHERDNSDIAPVQVHEPALSNAVLGKPCEPFFGLCAPPHDDDDAIVDERTQGPSRLQDHHDCGMASKCTPELTAAFLVPTERTELHRAHNGPGKPCPRARAQDTDKHKTQV